VKSRLLRLVILVLCVWAVLVSLLTVFESGQEDSTILSFWSAAWYSLVTLTTVGYGDMYPVTIAGKVIGALFLLGSLGVLGVLVYKVSERISQLRERRKMGYNGTNFKDHVVIIGWDDLAYSVTQELINADQRVAIITDKKDNIDLIREQYSKDDVFVLFADLKNVSLFEKAGVQNAGMVFMNLPTDTDKLIATLNIKKEYPGKRFVVTLDNADLKDSFQTAGVTYVLSKNEIASKLVASYIFEPDVAEYEADLLSSAKESHEYDIQEYRVTEDNPYLNNRYGEAFGDLKAKHNVLLIGIRKASGEDREMIKLPPDDVKIELGDHLIMIVNGVTERVISEMFKTQEGVL